MKKLLLLCASLCLSATAAFSQGGYFEGSLGFNYNDANENTVFTINPNIGFNVSDKWAVGFGLYGGYASESNIKTGEYGGIIFAQSFSKLTDWFYYTPRMYVKIGGGNIKETDRQYHNTDYKFFNVGVGASLLNFEFKVAPKTGVTVDLGGIALDYVKLKDLSEGNIQINVNAFQTANIGMRFHF